MAAARLPLFHPGDLDAEQRRLYETITASRTENRGTPGSIVDAAGRLRGAFAAMLLHPPLGHALQQLGKVIRYEGQLSARAREIAILAVAAHRRSEFQQVVHEEIGRRAGLTDIQVAALRDAQDLTFADPEEDAVLHLTRTLVVGDGLTDEEFERYTAVLGQVTIFELTTLVGYYTMLDLQIRVFRPVRAA